jgi:hypothetical protein
MNSVDNQRSSAVKRVKERVLCECYIKIKTWDEEADKWGIRFEKIQG